MDASQEVPDASACYSFTDVMSAALACDSAKLVFHIRPADAVQGPPGLEPHTLPGPGRTASIDEGPHTALPAVVSDCLMESICNLVSVLPAK